MRYTLSVNDLSQQELAEIVSKINGVEPPPEPPPEPEPPEPEPPPPEPPPEDLPNTILSVPFRTQAEIDTYVHGQLPASVRYNPSEDAAEIAVSGGSIKQERVTFGRVISSGVLIVRWSFKLNSQWFSSRGEINTHKAFMIARGGGGDTRRIEHRLRYGSAAARVDVRPYHIGAETGYLDGMEPQSTYNLVANKWVTFEATVDFSAELYSLQVDGTFVYLDVPIPNIDANYTGMSGPGLSEFWLEFNSSQRRTDTTRAVVGCFRDLVVLGDR